MHAIDPSCDSSSDFALADELSRLADVKIPKAIEQIRSAEVLHHTECEVDELPDVVRRFLHVIQ